MHVSRSIKARGERYDLEVDPRVLAHLRDAHGGKTAQEYRHDIFGRVLADWPQKISPQVLRLRLAEYASLLTDEQFAQGTCACCARSKRQIKLVSAQFPPGDSEGAPDRLECSRSDWKKHGVAWCDQIDRLLNIEVYLQSYFHADERVRTAEFDLVTAREKCTADGVSEADKQNAALLEAWRDRVLRWRENLREDLRADAVPAPQDPQKRWLLFAGRGSSLRVDAATRVVHCQLCRKCAVDLARKNSKGAPAPRLPLIARAHGLWGGPEPEVIRVLSYTERRILRLARVYSTIKRVMGQDVPWAGGNVSATPQYTTRNVVAYTQDPDVAVRTICLLPDDLCKDLYVQFEGGDVASVHREPALVVDLQHLRDAMWWFATHCWQWMLATKKHDVLSLAYLGEEMEGLLQAYRASLNGSDRGVPRPLVETATEIFSEHVSVTLPGPVDAAEDSDGSGQDNSSERKEVPKSCRNSLDVKRPIDSSVAIVDTGLQDLSPLRLWNSAMEKYQTLQQCESQYASASENCDDAAKAQALRDEAVAIAEAVHALKSLGSGAARKKLDEFHSFLDGDARVLRVSHDSKVLNTFDPNWWVCSFTDLFFRGDFTEQKGLGLRAWLGLLIRRVDYLGWAASKELAASGYNIALRRQQMWAVYRYVTYNKGSTRCFLPWRIFPPQTS